MNEADYNERERLRIEEEQLRIDRIRLGREMRRDAEARGRELPRDLSMAEYGCTCTFCGPAWCPLHD